jgi:hypothetical protein
VSLSKSMLSDGKFSIYDAMAVTPERSNNDPTPKRRTGDSSFLPVVIVSCVVILLFLIGAIVFIRSRKEKAVPLHSAPHTTSEVIQIPSRIHLNHLLSITF